MRHCRVFLVIVLMVVTVTACAADKDDLQVKKQPEIQQIKPKKPVKIKLKRSPKDEYTWELSGDDPDEIVRTDRKLRKMLNVP
jgi:predicted secreted protein